MACAVTCANDEDEYCEYSGDGSVSTCCPGEQTPCSTSTAVTCCDPSSEVCDTSSGYPTCDPISDFY
jgi:hypothetical protein